VRGYGARSHSFCVNPHSVFAQKLFSSRNDLTGNATRRIGGQRPGAIFSRDFINVSHKNLRAHRMT
jgi:hypothetical protein